MANAEHVDVLAQGVSVWNQWRLDNPLVRPDLRDLRFHDVFPSTRLGIDLSKANFRDTNLDGADLFNCWLVETDFTGAAATGAGFGGTTAGHVLFVGAILVGANFMESHLFGADFTGADLTDARFFGACLDEAVLKDQKLAGAWLENASLKKAVFYGTDLSRANLQGANLHATDLREAKLCSTDLRQARLVETEVEGTDFEGALVHGTSVWDLIGVPKRQGNLLVSKTEPFVRVDDLEVAQFIYLLLNRRKLRNVLTTLGEKTVLILGRFTERKSLLDGIADKLRALGYLPIIFDFERPTDRDLTETVKILAGLSLFVIADITNPRSVPLELQAVVPDYMVPFVTVLQRGQPAFGMFDDLPVKFHWALPLLEYNTAETLLAAFERAVVAPALKKSQEVRRLKALPSPRRSAEEELNNVRPLDGAV